MAEEPFSPDWRSILVERVPFYTDLSEEERERFEGQVRVFALTKEFSAGGGLSLTDEMKVVVAATACRLTMNMPWEHYAQVKHVALRAEAFRSHRGGMAIGQGGRWKVTISWPYLVEGLAVADDGHNVGYPEFAHALDGADDTLDGEAPSALAGFRRHRHARLAYMLAGRLVEADDWAIGIGRLRVELGDHHRAPPLRHSRRRPQ